MSDAPRNSIEDIKRYVPGMRAGNSLHGVEHLVILLFGLAGHGKSSLINSCVCVAKEEAYYNVAGAGTKYGGWTTKRTKHELTNTISMTDNRGFKALAPNEILEVTAQLRNLRLDGDMEWEKDNLKETTQCIPRVNIQPKEFLLPVIVHSCLSSLEKGGEQVMAQLIKKCQEINKMSPIVVITHAGPPNTENAALMENKFGLLGCTHRICLENYTDIRKDRNEEADRQFIRFMNICIDEAERGIRQRGCVNHLEVFANSVADQIKEEYEVKEMEMRRILEEKDNKLRELERRPWNRICQIL